MPRSLAAALALLASSPALVRAQEPAATPPPPAPATGAVEEPRDGPLATVRLRSGRVVTGRLASRDEGELVLLSEDGVRIVIPAASVEEVREAAAGATRGWEPDPNATRYLYSPSGFMLPRGEGYVSQTELLLTTVAYGVTDWLTVGAGGVFPAWFVDDGANLTGFVKVGGSVEPGLHVAATVQTLVIPGSDAAAVGLGFATVTFGGPDLHLGLSAGVPFIAGDEDDLGDVAISVSAVARVADRLAFVTENWLFPSSEEGFAVMGLAARFIGSRLAVDAGFVFAKGADVPLPWLDFTFNY